MAVTKSDLENNKPSSTSLLDFENGSGNIIDADLLDQNWTQNFSNILELYNYCIDQTPQTTVETTYTAPQVYNDGIKTNSIKEATLNSDIIVDPDGLGLFKYGGNDANLEVATKLFVNQQISGGVVNPIVFTGSTESDPGASGLVPQPLAEKQGKVLKASGDFGNYLDFSIQTTSFTAERDAGYIIDFSVSNTMTLPPDPNAGDRVAFAEVNGLTSILTIARNGNNIMNLAEDLLVDVSYGRGVLEYVDASKGWVFV